jgi:hypothetical protein
MLTWGSGFESGFAAGYIVGCLTVSLAVRAIYYKNIEKNAMEDKDHEV